MNPNISPNNTLAQNWQYAANDGWVDLDETYQIIFAAKQRGVTEQDSNDLDLIVTDAKSRLVSDYGKFCAASAPVHALCSPWSTQFETSSCQKALAARQQASRNVDSSNNNLQAAGEIRFVLSDGHKDYDRYFGTCRDFK